MISFQILGFVALLAVSVNAGGLAHLPEQHHEGYQTPFLPVAGPQLPSAGYAAAEPLPIPQAYHSAGQYEAAAHHQHHEVSAQYAAAAPQFAAAPQYAAPAPLVQPLAVSQHIEPFVAPQPTVQLQKTIIKHIQVNISFFFFFILIFGKT